MNKYKFYYKRIININKLKNKSTIFKLSVYLCVGIFLLCAYNFGRSNSFGLSDLAYVNSNNLDVSTSYTQEADEITELVINWHSGDITLESTSKSYVYISENTESEISSSEKLTLEQNGEVLTINWDSDYNILNLPDQLQKNLIINIPSTVETITIKSENSDIYVSDLDLESLKVNVDTSNLIVKNCTTEIFDIDLKDGNAVISDILCSKFDVSSKKANQDLSDIIATDFSSKSTYGDIEIIGNIYNGNIYSVYGDIDFTSQVVMNELTVNALVGTVNLSVVENSGFILKTSNGIGEIAIEDFEITEKDDTQYYKNSYVTNIYTLGTTTGSVNMVQGSFISDELNYDEYIQNLLDEDE
ncbi:MAG: DUF4097 family beta strand repeat-containing protein [Clostridia bacterium]